MKDLIKRLTRQRFEREEMHNNYGMVGVPCDEDDYGAEAYNVNPDGPEAAALIATLAGAMQGVADIVYRAESNASGNPEWDYVGPRVAAFRAALVTTIDPVQEKSE
jgi:hypothetical protein